MRDEDIKVGHWYYATKDIASAEPLIPAKIIEELGSGVFLVDFYTTHWRTSVVPAYSIIEECRDPNMLRRIITRIRRVKQWIAYHL